MQTLRTRNCCIILVSTFLNGISGGVYSGLLLAAESDVESGHIARGFIHWGLENTQGQRRHNVCVKPVPMLGCPHGEKDFPYPCVEPSLFHHLTIVYYTMTLCKVIFSADCLDKGPFHCAPVFSSPCSLFIHIPVTHPKLLL